MAYSAPELLLVGAAQNLVLGDSDEAPKSVNPSSPCLDDIDPATQAYVNENAW